MDLFIRGIGDYPLIELTVISRRIISNGFVSGDVFISGEALRVRGRIKKSQDKNKRQKERQNARITFHY